LSWLAEEQRVGEEGERADHTGEEVGLIPAALCHRDFCLFWGGVVLSAVGSQFTTVAMAWQMYELTNSAWQIGLLGLARAVPQIVLALLGDLMADAAVAAYGVCTMIFAVSMAFWLALLMLAGTGAGNMVGGVWRSTINQVLTPDHFRGRVAAVNSIFTMGGPQLGQFESGVVATLWSPEASTLTDGLGALLVVWGVAMLPKVRHFRLADDVTQRTG
jgi:hypothetical protein